MSTGFETRDAPARVRHPLQAVRKAIRLHPRWPDLRCRLGSFLLEAGETQLALHEIAEALAIHPRFLAARKLAIRAALELGDVATAGEQSCNRMFTPLRISVRPP